MLMVMSARRAQTQRDVGKSARRRVATMPLEAAEVAELPDRALNAMTDEELLCVIQAANRLLPRAMRDHGRLAHKDRATLHRMACLARRACRNRCCAD